MMTRRRERAWRVDVEGFPTITTSELTVDEAALVEKVCGVPWVLMNPMASVNVAKGLLTVLLRRSLLNTGRTDEQAEDEAIKAAGSMTIDRLHGAFTFLPGERDTPSPESEGADPPSSAPSSVSG